MTYKNNSIEQWQSKYHECLALEFSSPDYFAVHHLLVITYMIQSDGYSDAYFTKAAELLRGFVHDALTPEEFITTYSSLKNTAIENRSGNRDIEKYKWNLTILSLRTTTATLYCSDVKAWAMDVLRVIDKDKSKNECES